MMKQNAKRVCRRHHIGAALICLVTLNNLVAANNGDGENSKRLVIACSTTQIADFTRQIVGDRCEVRCVLSPGQDPHMFEVTQAAISIVQSADLCLDNGLHLEGGDWMRTAAENESKPIKSCTDGMPPLRIEENGQMVVDPHAWFSPAIVSRYYLSNIVDAISKIDPEHAAEYEARRECFQEQLRALDNWAKRQFNRVPAKRRVLVTSHDAFNYFCDAFGLEGRAPVGWSTEEVGGEVSQASRQKVVDSIRESGVPAIFVETSVNPGAVKAIAREAGVSIGGELYSDSMGSPGTAGESYIGMMRENVLKIVSGLSVD